MGLKLKLKLGFNAGGGGHQQRHAGVVAEVRIPFISAKKKDLASPNKRHQDCIAINAHSKTSLHKNVCGDDGVLIMVHVPKASRASGVQAEEKMKGATVVSLPGVTQDIAGYKIAHQPSIYVLETPGVSLT